MLQVHTPREYARIAALMAAQAECFHEPWWTLETSKDLSIFTNIVQEHIGWSEEEFWNLQKMSRASYWGYMEALRIIVHALKPKDEGAPRKPGPWLRTCLVEASSAIASPIEWEGTAQDYKCISIEKCPHWTRYESSDQKRRKRQPRSFNDDWGASFGGGGWHS